MALMAIGHGRDELDEEEGQELAQRIRDAVEQPTSVPTSRL